MNNWIKTAAEKKLHFKEWVCYFVVKSSRELLAERQTREKGQKEVTIMYWSGLKGRDKERNSSGKFNATEIAKLLDLHICKS